MEIEAFRLPWNRCCHLTKYARFPPPAILLGEVLISLTGVFVLQTWNSSPCPARVPGPFAAPSAIVFSNTSIPPQSQPDHGTMLSPRCADLQVLHFCHSISTSECFARVVMFGKWRLWFNSAHGDLWSFSPAMGRIGQESCPILPNAGQNVGQTSARASKSKTSIFQTSPDAWNMRSCYQNGSSAKLGCWPPKRYGARAGVGEKWRHRKKNCDGGSLPNKEKIATLRQNSGRGGGGASRNTQWQKNGINYGKMQVILNGSPNNAIHIRGMQLMNRKMWWITDY